MLLGYSPPVPMSASDNSRTGPSSRLVIGSIVAAVWTLWLLGLLLGDRAGLFADNWFMSVTMAFGSFIAGATSEGGGAVAFPVMTLFFGIEPATARDFSLMIQAVGMSAAGATILLTRIPVERHAIVWASAGGALGMVLGLEFLSGLLPPPYVKMLFTSTWLSFAVGLYLINRYHEREVHEEITNFLPRHAVLLFGTGIIGGLISSQTGSGLDITVFALLVLRLRINEKIATPTSVVLMGINSVVGFLWKDVQGAGMAPAAWGYWWVCVPIVVVGAPFGAWFIKFRSRLFVAMLLYVSIGVQFVSALLIIPMTTQLVGFSAAIFVAGSLLFRWMAARGVRRLEWLSDRFPRPEAT